MNSRTSTKVSKKLKLSKSKVNYRKHERRLIHRATRREGKLQEQEVKQS